MLRAGRSIRIAATVAGFAAGITLAGSAAPALAAEAPTPRPIDGVLHLSGRGFGHGRGMSQWGAQGAAATAGLSWTAILDFYYPGARRDILSDTTLKVWIQADDDGAVTVLPAPGLAVAATDGTTQTLPVGNGYRAWRIAGSAGALSVQYRDTAGSWQPYAPATTLTGNDLAFRADTTLRLVLPGGRQEEVRGTLHAAYGDGAVRTILHTPMETYLKGVVPNEMPAGWHPQALAAQSVAARTYAAQYRDRQRRNGRFYDICDSTQCQVFSGVATYAADGTGRSPKEWPSSNAAVAATAGTVLRSPSGNLASTEFSASNGGWTTDGGVSYLPAKSDPYDGALGGNSNTLWSTTVSVSRFERAYGLGRLVRVRVLQRDGNGAWGGRVLSIRFEGTTRSVTVSGDDVRRMLGLRSNWFEFTDRADLPRDWNGDGAPDLLSRTATGELRVSPSGGTGTGALFGASTTVGRGWNLMDRVIAAGQWDDTGSQDVIARVARTGDLLLYPRSSSGTWTKARLLARGMGKYAQFAVTPSVVGDGRQDLLAVDGTGRLVVFPGRASGALGTASVAGTGFGGTRFLLAPGDMSGDGIADLVQVRTDGSVQLHAGLRAGGFAAPRKMTGGWGIFTAATTIGDVTGDARPDVLALKSNGDLLVYRGSGASTFTDVRVAARGLSGLLPTG